MTQAEYVKSLILAGLTGGLTACSLLTLFVFAPRYMGLQRSLSFSREVEELEEGMTVRELRGIAKRRGVRVGKGNKKDIARRIAEEKRDMGWRGKLPFY